MRSEKWLRTEIASLIRIRRAVGLNDFARQRLFTLQEILNDKPNNIQGEK